ncbi:MAG TPA: RsmE family RNA methyltransferase [Acidimicrobiales bacterium]|nr:RsmE family RNA methyltransferase [Acidimicrobiales bacterium]
MSPGENPVRGDGSGDALRAAAAMVFVADLDVLDTPPDQSHHLSRVLRLRAGEAVAAGDGAGNWRVCRYRGGRSDGAESGTLLEPDGPVVSCPRPSPAITVAFVPVKGDRPEWTVQKLTEAGVDHIALLRSVRGVVRWEEERQDKAIARLRRVAREAAAQSRRLWLPHVAGVLSIDALARDVSPVPLALADPVGGPPTLRLPAVAIGPEGGWDPKETAAGRPVVGLGPRILRAETAAVAAGLLLCALRDHMVAPSEGGGDA